MFETYKKNILDFYKRTKRMPSYAEIMDITGLKSKSPVFKLVNKLIEAGIVSKDENGRLIPESIAPGILRLTQPVSAGTGSYAEEAIAERISLDEWLSGKVNSYMLDVQGDSMKDVGILDGDSVIVEKESRNFQDGQTVVALMNDGYTIKTLRKTSKGMSLEPANVKYKPIYPSEDNQIELVGIVRGVVRKL